MERDSLSGEESKRTQKQSLLKEKLASISSSISGVLSFLGGYQVCHNVCLGIIAVLSLIGITVVGMPLLFLQTVAIPFWIAGVVLFTVSLGLYFRMRCISRNLLMLNAGVLLAAVPFSWAQPILPFLWIVGGAIVIISLLLIVKEKVRKRQQNSKIGD